MPSWLEWFRWPIVVCYYFAAATSIFISDGDIHEEFKGESRKTVEPETESS